MTGKGLLRSGLVTRDNMMKRNIEPPLSNFGNNKISMMNFSPVEDCKELEMLNILSANMSSNYWKTRLDSIEGLIMIYEKIGKCLVTSGKFIMVLQALIKGLTDNNAKVALKSIYALERFIPMFKTKIEENIKALLTGISVVLCSANATLKNKAELHSDLLIVKVESI